jgi:mRNA interferase MazF
MNGLSLPENDMTPSRGDIWMADLDPIRGREQAGTRPVLVISVDAFNRGPSELVVALPLTSKNKRILYHVPVIPPEGGLSVPSYIKCEDIRSLSVERLAQYRGRVSQETMEAVSAILRALIDI